MNLLVRDHMTAAPHTVGQEQTVDQAESLMKKYRVRHLPVLHGGALVGLVSDRDLAIAGRLAGGDTPVEEAMTPEPYTVRTTASLAEVAAHMAEQRLGSAVVVDATDRVLGIFTTVDAMRALGRLLAAADASAAPKSSSATGTAKAAKSPRRTPNGPSAAKPAKSAAAKARKRA